MEEKEKGRFWELVLSTLVGTAAGYVIAHYASGRKGPNLDRYIDKGIGFLEDMKRRDRPPGYGDK